VSHRYLRLIDPRPKIWFHPLALSEQRGQTMLTLEDPGGDTLEKSLSGPMDTAQFLRCAIGFATALGGLHGRRLIHKDVKPANALINPATGQMNRISVTSGSTRTAFAPHDRSHNRSPEPIPRYRSTRSCNRPTVIRAVESLVGRLRSSRPSDSEAREWTCRVTCRAWSFACSWS
jgi:serine/threonine protein kinase